MAALKLLKQRRDGVPVSLYKADVVSTMACRSGLTEQQAEGVLDAFQEVLAESLATGEAVTLPGLLSVERVARDARRGHNLGTGEEILIPAGFGVKISAGPLLRRAVHARRMDQNDNASGRGLSRDEANRHRLTGAHVGSTIVDQIGPDGGLIADVDTTLSEKEKNELLVSALPGAAASTFAGARVVRFRNQVILKAQVTHLGYPWPAYKKRIQIPKSWLEVERQATRDGLVTRFVGIYRYRDVTVFVDFDPRTYIQRAANNSAAHVATNDLHQAQTLGLFERVDRNGNRLTSVRSELFADYLLGVADTTHPSVDVFRRFNQDFFTGRWLRALDAVQEMHAAAWPDRFQNEWAGFYLEYRFDRFVRAEGLAAVVQFQKKKQRGGYDYDLVFHDGPRVDFYGDLKASNIVKQEAIGNDRDDLVRCLEEFGRFWYVIYEHDTVHGKTNGDVATIEWNEWRRSVGHVQGKEYSPLSYSGRFKESVRFARMQVLEVNEANASLVLGDHYQGRQPSGAAREPKVKILKKHIDNFLIFSSALPEVPSGRRV